MVSTRPITQRTIPAVAMPFRGPLMLLMPKTRPVMVVGKPTIGRNQAIRPNSPRHNDQIAFPPASGVGAGPYGFGTGADGWITVSRTTRDSRHYRRGGCNGSVRTRLR